jgi:hypothetical protein
MNKHHHISGLHCVTLAMTPKIQNKKMTNPIAPIEAVSSQRSEEIEPKAGIANPNRRGQFALNSVQKKGRTLLYDPFDIL